MGERDPRRGSARLPGSVLQATGDPGGDRHLSLLLRYASSCPSTSRCKGSTASSKSRGNPRMQGLQGLTRLCTVRGEGEVYQAPSHPLQALLGASQTAFCASPG